MNMIHQTRFDSDLQVSCRWQRAEGNHEMTDAEKTAENHLTTCDDRRANCFGVRPWECVVNHTECDDMHIIALTLWTMMIVVVVVASQMANKQSRSKCNLFVLLLMGHRRRLENGGSQTRWKSEHIRDCRPLLSYIVCICVAMSARRINRCHRIQYARRKNTTQTPTYGQLFIHIIRAELAMHSGRTKQKKKNMKTAKRKIPNKFTRWQI